MLTLPSNALIFRRILILHTQPSARMREGYGSCLVCLCVCLYLSVTALAASASVAPATNDTHGFLLGFSWILIRGFSKKPSVQKLLRGKSQYANELELTVSRFCALSGPTKGSRVLHFSASFIQVEMHDEFCRAHSHNPRRIKLLSCVLGSSSWSQADHPAHCPSHSLHGSGRHI